jgi:hypothetical protein
MVTLPSPKHVEIALEPPPYLGLEGGILAGGEGPVELGFLDEEQRRGKRSRLPTWSPCVCETAT